ncbi:hypothetical protein H8356DRAFT_498390 [Neocallimastix lanati (nom. inval.)]|jgi:hypothetical protein|nr:hypothetical protein H8356DRAFT_498390 [Neocallimastix sp. JGI-2020a]
MHNKSIILLSCFIYNITAVKAEPPNCTQIYATTTLISCIAYIVIYFIIKKAKGLFKNSSKGSNLEDNDIKSETSSEVSTNSLIMKYENVKDINSSLPPSSIKAYISSQQWTEHINSLKLYNNHRNHFFSFHPLYFPIVSGIVKFCQYYILYNQWSNYLNEKVVNNGSNYSEIQEIEKKYSMNVGENIIIRICIILIIEDILCFIMYYWFSKYMVKKNHTTFTSKFIRANETLKNEDIPLVWVLDWKPPKYTSFGFEERCIIELHLIEEDNIIIIK